MFRLLKCGFHNCRECFRAVCVELCGVTEEDGSLPIEFIVCAKELPAVVERLHLLAFENRNELNTGMPRFPRPKTHFKAQPRITVNGGRVGILDLHNQPAMNISNTSIALMRVAVFGSVVIAQFGTARGKTPPTSS